MRFFRALILSSFLLLVPSCLKMSYPEVIMYKLELSGDVLSLFDVRVEFYDSSNLLEKANVSLESWNARVVKTDALVPQMTVFLTAHKSVELKKDTYEMKVSPSIVTGLSPFQTKAGDAGEITIQFSVPCEGGTMATAKVAPLKFNKHFAFSFSVDDSSENGWSKMFALFNGMWIDDIEYFHKGVERTTGYQPEYPLCITDGCGNDRRFTFGEAIWPNSWNTYVKDGFIQDVITSTYNPYISWVELQIMTDMGNAVYWHNIDDNSHDQSVSQEIVTGLQEDYIKTYSKIGYPLKTLAQPDGNPAYLQAAQDSPLVYVTRATTNPEEVPLKNMGSLKKKNIFGGLTGDGLQSKLIELEAQSASDNPLLSGLLAHGPKEEHIDFFNTIYEKYGKKGSDNIWVSSYDEIYEYAEQRSGARISSRKDGSNTVFEVTIPSDEKFIYNELSFIVDGASGAAQRISDNLYGFSSAVQKDGSVLVNCRYDKRAVQLAEKYISIYDTTYDQLDKSFAQYLISLLRDDLQKSLTEKLEKVKKPTEEDYPINGTYSKADMAKYISLYDGKQIVTTL